MSAIQQLTEQMRAVLQARGPQPAGWLEERLHSVPWKPHSATLQPQQRRQALGAANKAHI